MGAALPVYSQGEGVSYTSSEAAQKLHVLPYLFILSLVFAVIETGVVVFLQTYSEEEKREVGMLG